MIETGYKVPVKGKVIYKQEGASLTALYPFEDDRAYMLQSILGGLEVVRLYLGGPNFVTS